MTTALEELDIALSMGNEDWACMSEPVTRADRVSAYDDGKRLGGQPDFVVEAQFHRRRPRPLWGQWDEACLHKLKVEVAGEWGLTQRSILNVLLAEWLDLPPERRRAVKDAALEWEREMKP